MGTSVISPNSLVHQTSVTLVGAANAQTAWSDNNDATYTYEHSNVRVAFGNPTIPAGAQIRSVQIKMRMSRNGAYNGNVYFYLGHSNIEPQDFGPDIKGAGIYNTTVLHIEGGAHASNRLSQPWSVADVNALECTVWDDTPGTGLRVHEIDVYVTYNEKPTISSVQPSATVTTTTRPTVTATYTDPESDLLERYQVKVFTSAQYGAGGFNAETSAHTYYSGIIYGSTVYHQLLEDLAVGSTVKFYVKGADKGSNGRYSDWVASPAVLINPTTPSTPSAPTIATDTATGSLVVTQSLSGVTWTSGNSAHYVVLERSNDGGTTWLPVYGSPFSVLGTDTSKVVTDYAADPGTSVIYRSRLRVTKSADGAIIAGAYSANSSGGTNVGSGWWLKDLETPARNMQPDFIGTEFKTVSDEDVSLYHPVGVPNAVSVSDVVRGEKFDLEMEFLTDAEYDKFKVLRDSRRVLLLQSFWMSKQWYIKFSGARTHIRSNTTPILHTVTITAEEVAPL